MKHLKITYQGKVYEVDVEETVNGVSVTPSAPAAAAPATPKAATPAPASTASGSGVLQEVEAPMSGRIAKILVAPGTAVQDGDEIMILEAMKLENSIYAESDGVVSEVLVKLNQIVSAGDILAVIK